MYVFSIDPETGKIAHANFVAPSLKAQGVDARTWAAKVTDVVGGKVRSLVCLWVAITECFCRLAARRTLHRALGSRARPTRRSLRRNNTYLPLSRHHRPLIDFLFISIFCFAVWGGLGYLLLLCISLVFAVDKFKHIHIFIHVN